MKKLFFLLLLGCWALAGVAQRLSPGAGSSTAGIPGGGGGTPTPPSRWKQHIDSVFQHIDRAPVGTGLLTNYGFALKNYNLFQGTALTPANRLQNLAEWRLLYGAMQTSVFNANATLPPLSTANFRLQQRQQQAPGVVHVAALLVRYDRFRDDAGTAGLVTVSNRQLHDTPNRPYSPYEQRTLVALCPVVAKVASRSPQFSFPSQLLFTNAASAITALEFDAGEGQGYRAVAWDQPLTATYAANGSYTLRFRLTCADGAVLLSHSRLDVSEPPAARYLPTGRANVLTRHSSVLFTDTRPYSSFVSSLPTIAATGTVTVAFADGNTTGTIRKPLIVVEGYDPSSAVNTGGVTRVGDYTYNSFTQGDIFGGLNITYNDAVTNQFVNFNDQLHEVGQYDLIFLSYDNGTDYMQSNAYLVERLIQWVNDTKQPLNGVPQQNIVMGMSMGGLIARYALRDMEVRRAANPALPAHDTKLYISHEAPHQGANVPLGFQYLVSGVATLTLIPGLQVADLQPDLRAFAGLLNTPATRQLLIYQTSSVDNDIHAAWLSEYNGLGYPQQCRNIATSGGSECGRPQDFAPYAELLNIRG